MRLVTVENSDENEVPAAIPEVPATLYGELFVAADWAVVNRPWEKSAGAAACELSDLSGEEKWQVFWSHSDEGVASLLLVRKSDFKKTGAYGRLEIQFIVSDFLQGHDYELNVRYAPESWDACERDVIILRAFSGEGSPEHPNFEQVRLLRDALLVLKKSE